MKKQKEKTEVIITPLDTKQMRVAPDGKSIVIAGQRFKRTVLPSVAVKTPEPELDVLSDEEPCTDQTI